MDAQPSLFSSHHPQPTAFRGTDCPAESHTPGVIVRWAPGAGSGSLTWFTGESPLLLSGLVLDR